MARKVTGKVSREMNRETVNISGPKTCSGSRLRSPRKISAPDSAGVGRVYMDDDDI